MLGIVQNCLTEVSVGGHSDAIRMVSLVGWGGSVKAAVIDAGEGVQALQRACTEAHRVRGPATWHGHSGTEEWRIYCDNPLDCATM